MFDATYGTGTMRVYIRFGKIPEDGKSKIHLGDEIAGIEPGVSVWPCMESNGYYYPILPPNPTETTVSDFYHSIFSNKPVYLVTGREHRVCGHDGEPCLVDTIIIKELKPYGERLNGYC